MAVRNIIIKGMKAKRGERMIPGRGYSLVTKTNGVFKGTLLHTINSGGNRFAIFSVPK